MNNFDQLSKEEDNSGEKFIQKFVQKTCKNILRTIQKTVPLKEQKLSDLIDEVSRTQNQTFDSKKSQKMNSKSNE